jgi:hypothetical protein
MLEAKIRTLPHAGKWDAKELKRYAQRPPAFFFTVMGGAVERQPDINFPAQCVGVLMCEDRKGQRKEDQVLEYSDLILRSLGSTENDTCLWGLSNAIKRPYKIAARNMHSADIDAEGVALWAVTWQQSFDLTEESDGSIVPLAGWNASWYAPGVVGRDTSTDPDGPYAEDAQDSPE